VHFVVVTQNPLDVKRPLLDIVPTHAYSALYGAWELGGIHFFSTSLADLCKAHMWRRWRARAPL